MVAEACDKEYVLFSIDGEDEGSHYLHRDLAEALAKEILDAVQKSHNADELPVCTLTEEQYKNKDYPMDQNLDVLNENGKLSWSLRPFSCRIIAYP